MEKKEWIENIYLCVKNLADKDYQERVWVKGIGSEVDSYIESICTLYDNYRFQEFLERYQDFNLSLNLFNQLKILNEKLSNYQEKDTDMEILADPKWNEIIECSKETIKLFEQDFSMNKN